uniref:Receptor-type tyrosine-protein phosphatase O n=1 Tax=Magallana gigas TaxID=29159 RepID=K1PXK6_MAGGI
MSIPNSTNETSLSLTGLKPGTTYMFTVIQQTNGPFAKPGPPTAVEVVDVGQRNISINVTDTDTPNGDIVGYSFHIMYKLYPDETEYMENANFLHKMMSNIYVLERHIYPGAQYNIAVFTVNDAFNSLLNVTLQDITTLPDTPGQVDVHTPSYINETTTNAVILWRRPSHPNGNMKAYRAMLESGPDISNCRIYYLCFDVCNNTILGPPKDTCMISNDTTLMENQKIMSLLVDNLRLGTTYTLSVVGYNEAGEGKSPQTISLTTKSIRPKPVETGTFIFSSSRYVVTWTSPSFSGEDLRYSVSLKDAIRGGVLRYLNISDSSLSLPSDLHKYYNYTVVVVAHTSAGRANPSQYTFTTPYAGNSACMDLYLAGSLVEDGCVPIYAISSKSNQEGNIITIRRFQSSECPEDNTPEIVGIVFAFLILLGICLAVIIFVYRKKVREIEETYTNGPNVPPVQGGGGITPIPDEEIELNRPFILSDAQKSFEEKSADSNRLFLMEYDDKCEHYWPDTVNEPKQYGDIVVNLISVSNMDKFDINIFQVSQGDYTRTIKHFHFLEWPDFSAAVDSTVVIDFIQTVRTHITPEVKGPLLIHCSAGVGRTGTYITIDYLLQFVRDHDLGQSVDIFAWVVQMRKNRVSMVQVDKQYIFIHRALTELIDRKRNGLLQSQDDTTILNEIVTLGQHVNAAKIMDNTTTNLARETLKGFVLNVHQIPMNLSMAIPMRTMEEAAFMKNVTNLELLHKAG